MKRWSRTTLGVAAALVLGLVLAGVGVAGGREEGGQSLRERFVARVAELLGEEPAAVRTAIERARGEVLDEAVARGDISQERAKKPERRLQRQRWSRTGRGVVVGRIADRHRDTLTVRTPRGERRVRLDGDTVVLSREEARKDALREGVRVRVKGRTSRDGVVEARRVRVLPARPAQARGLLGQVRDISDVVGMTPGELRAKLRQGKSLSQIAGPEKSPRVIDILTSAARARLDEAVGEGRISEDKAVQLREAIEERVVRFVNHGWTRE